MQQLTWILFFLPFEQCMEPDTIKNLMDNFKPTSLHKRMTNSNTYSTFPVSVRAEALIVDAETAIIFSSARPKDLVRG
jgi:hypothetical protein